MIRKIKLKMKRKLLHEIRCATVKSRAKFLPQSFYIFSESFTQDKLIDENYSSFGPVFTELWVFESLGLG
jgi:hypothetical protein